MEDSVCKSCRGPVLKSWKSLQLEFQSNDFGRDINCPNAEAETDLFPKSINDEGCKYSGFIYGVVACLCFSISSIGFHLFFGKSNPMSLWFIKYLEITVMSLVFLSYFAFIKKRKLLNTTDQNVSQKTLIFNCTLLLVHGLLGLYSASNTFSDLTSSSFHKLSSQPPPITLIPIVVAFISYFTFNDSIRCLHLTILIGLYLIGLTMLIGPLAIFHNLQFMTMVMDMNILYTIWITSTLVILHALNYIIIRLLKSIHWSLILFLYGLIGLIGITLLSYYTNSHSMKMITLEILTMNSTTIIDCVMIVILVLLNLTGQIYFILALQNEIPFIIALVQSGELVLQFILAYFVGNTHSDANVLSIFGALAILGSILLAGFFRIFK